MSALGVIIGCIVTIATTIFVEWLRKPRIHIDIDPHADVPFKVGPAREARFLYVRVRCKQLPGIARWMSRNPALQCHGMISFHDLEGQDIFGRAMPLRWSDAPEPVAPHAIINNVSVALIDPDRISMIAHRNIYPGESERADIGVRFDDDDDCYGWSNENYFSDPQWRNPRWRLRTQCFLARVMVKSAGDRSSGLFRVVNYSSRRDFRLEPAQPEDRKRIADRYGPI